MTESDLRQLIKKIYESTGLEFDLADDETWDSLLHIAILVGLDEAYEGKISSINELQISRSVTDLVALLKNKGLIE